jgi:hypothetical protein
LLSTCRGRQQDCRCKQGRDNTCHGGFKPVLCGRDN